MENKLSLRYFKLQCCGYYTHSQKGSNNFEDLTLTLSHLEDYVKDKTIEETGISRGEDKPQTFVLDVCQKNGLWLIALWNPTPEGSADEIISLNMKSRFGQVDSSQVQAGQDKTFGFVSYFLLWPQHHFYATILPPNATLAGRAEFEEYMLNFLWADPAFVVDSVNAEILEDDGTKTLTKTGFKLPISLQGVVSPRFKAKLAKTSSEKDFVIQNYDKITQLHNRCTMKITAQQSSQRLLKKIVPKLFGNTDLFASLDTIRMNHSISAAFKSKKDLKTWIKEWEHNSSDTEKDDCGFKLKGDDRIYWINGNTIKCEVPAEGLRKVKGIYPARKILDTLEQRKDLILQTFKQSDDT